MLRRTAIALVAITIFMSVTALAGPKTGCTKFNFIGTFLAPSQQDVFEDGHIHKFAFQLTLNSDGTANQYWTGLPDYMINVGTGSPQIGSWTCRDDGKLVIVLLGASYDAVVPLNVSDSPNSQDANIATPDVRLAFHSRTTYLFTVDDDNTVTRVQSRTRSYSPAQDPTDAAGGRLLRLPAPADTITRVYKRLAASDADLLAPQTP